MKNIFLVVAALMVIFIICGCARHPPKIQNGVYSLAGVVITSTNDGLTSNHVILKVNEENVADVSLGDKVIIVNDTIAIQGAIFKNLRKNCYGIKLNGYITHDRRKEFRVYSEHAGKASTQAQSTRTRDMDTDTRTGRSAGTNPATSKR